MNKQDSSSRGGGFSISIGGIAFAIYLNDATLLETLRTRYRWFESPGSAGYEIRVTVLPFEELTRGQDTPQTIAPQVEVVKSEDKFIIRRADNPFEALVDTSLKKVSVRMWNSQYCFDSFLRILLTLILTDDNGLLLHAAAVSDGKRGCIFFGPSGSGKTTVARLSAGRTILTDELALIRSHDGGYRVFGTPFWGEFTPGRSNSHADLSNLYALKKAGTNKLVPVDRVRAVAELYRCVLFFSSEANLLSQILDTCVSLVDSVPVHEIHFLPDPSFWQVVNGQSQEEYHHA